MKKHLAVMTLLAAILSGTGVAQVFWTVYPDPVPLEQPVLLRITNQLRSTIQLPNSAPWAIYDQANQLVYAPVNLPVIVPVPPLASKSWTWNQKDLQGKQVKPGTYVAQISYWAGGKKYTLKTPFQILPVTFTVSGKPSLGGRVRLDLFTPTSTGNPYQLACSLGNRPGLPLPGNRLLLLNPDFLFFLSISGMLPQIFASFSGTTSKSGYATGYVNIPRWPGLVGLTIWSAGLTFQASAPGGIHMYSVSKSFTIVP